MHGLEIGQRFERYHVLRIMGNGVSSTSYEAEDLMLHRKVVLKLIHPWSALADSARRQFFRDMQSISLLVHPYHAAILDYGEVEGQLYVARQFVSNGSLLSAEGRTWFSPPFSIANTLSYAYQLAQVLYNIHRYGYIHGSLTLSNILVLHSTPSAGETNFAPFLLSDIGLAHFVRRFGHPQIVRLPITAAPEQAKGRHLPASDQYALATLVYLWLTGRPPFIGSPEEIEQAKYKAIFPVISSFNLQITLEQEGIIRRALSALPDERYPTILTFIEVLQNSIARQAKLQEKTLAYELSTPTIPIQLTYPVEIPETPYPDTSTHLPEIEHNDAPALTESDFVTADYAVIDGDKSDPVTADQDAIDGDIGAISSTFMLDQDAILLLTSIAKQEQLPPEPAPQIEPDTPLPRPGETPLPHVEPAPETKPTQPEPPTPAEPTIPEVLPPAPDIAQPLPEPKLPEIQPETSPAPSIDPQKTPEQPPMPTNDAIGSITLTITSSYLPTPQELNFEKEEITLGRAGSSDILLDRDPLTSRHHAKLVRTDDQYYLYDLRSANGIMVNDQKLKPEVGFLLTDGDQIHICSYTLIPHFISVQHNYEQKKEPAIS